MSRTFPSAKAAIGYACAVQGSACGPASRRESDPGPPPDQWLAASVFACFTRAGVDPHADTPVLRGVLAWATHADGAVLEDQRVGSAVGRIAAELEAAGLVVPQRVSLRDVGWRAIEVDGRVRYVSTTHLDAEGVAADLESLRARVESGQEAPQRCEVVTPDPAVAWSVLVEQIGPLVDSARELDRRLAQAWGCSERTARTRRLAAQARTA